MLETKYYKKAVLLGAAFLYLYSYKAVEPYDYQVPYVTQGRQEQIAYWSEVLQKKCLRIQNRFRIIKMW